MRTLKRLLLITLGCTVFFLFLGGMLQVSKATVYSPHCINSVCPTSYIDTGTIVRHTAYTLRNNPETKFADWVAYKVTPKTIATGAKRVWRADPLIDPDHTLEPSDYRGANSALGTDRGHQAPLASLAGLKNAHELNYLSNITPQKAELNQGPWVKVETFVRDWVTYTGGTVYGVTGPLYDEPMPTLPGADESHLIPSGYWKILTFKYQFGQTVAIAFLMPQDTGRNTDPCSFQVSLETVEDLVPYNVIWNEPETIVTCPIGQDIGVVAFSMRYK